MYICNVFFIVLDLRLIRLEYSGTPFFISSVKNIFFNLYETFICAILCCIWLMTNKIVLHFCEKTQFSSLRDSFEMSLRCVRDVFKGKMYCCVIKNIEHKKGSTKSEAFLAIEFCLVISWICDRVSNQESSHQEFLCLYSVSH